LSPGAMRSRRLRQLIYHRIEAIIRIIHKMALYIKADLHSLFDLGLLAINPMNMKVALSRQLLNTHYAEYHNRVYRADTKTKCRGAVRTFRMVRDCGGGFRREAQPRRQHWFLNEKSGFPFRTPAFCSVSRGQRRLGEEEYRAPSVTPGVALRPRTQGSMMRSPRR
jgi:hypothetical protein